MQMTNRAGEYRINGLGDLQYRSFIPAKLPPNPEIILDNEALNLLILASNNVYALEKASKLIPDANLFIAMYVRKESLISSQIEGTVATLEDIMSPNIEANTNLDVEEVVNYIKATSYAVDRLKEFPLCNRLIRETHAILLSGVRGQNQSPGEFRKSQNWIGSAGCTLKTARYIPPNINDMDKALSDLEKYINTEDDTLHPLIRAGLIHYQFETIHPFLDGNGRMGRLLIILFLIQENVISSPILYLSYFLKKNQIEYYDRLNEVRLKGNFEQWIKFFLEGIYETASDALLTIEKLILLREQNIEKISKFEGNTKNLMQLFSYIEKYPIIDISKTARDLNLSYNGASNLISKLCNLNILEETTGKRRNRVFSYEAYLDLFRNGT